MEDLAKHLKGLAESMPNSTVELEPCEKCRKGRGVLSWENSANGKSRVFCDCAYGEKTKAAYECQREDERRYRVTQLYMAAKVPKRYEKATLSDFYSTCDDSNPTPDEQMAEALIEAMDIDQGKGALLWGGVGTGKTHLAVAELLDQIVEYSHSGLFVSVPDLLDQIRATYNRNNDDEDPFERLQTVKLLVLDDIGAERATDWVREKLYQIINARYNNCKAIIATSNLNPDQLAEKIGDRTVSRLMEICTPIKMNGPDRRVAKR